MATFRPGFRMRRSTALAAAALATGILVPWVGRAYAQSDVSAPTSEPGATAYARVITSAVSAFEAGHFEDALTGFTQAHRLQPSARTWRGIGLASYSLEDVVRARRAFEQALIDPRRPLAEAQRAEVEALLRETARRTGRFQLQLQPVGARVEIDGVPTTERELVLTVGDHTLVVSAPGYTTHERTLPVQSEEVSALPIALTPVVTGATATPVTTRAPVTASAPAASTQTAEDDSGNALPWLVLGAAPVFAISSAVVWWSGLAERNAIERQCAVDLCTRSESDRRVEAAHIGSYETWTNVLLGASIVTAATGATMLLLSTSNNPNADTLTLSAGASGLRLDGHF